MASAKKAKKSRKTTPKRSKAAPSQKQRSFENVSTPEELVAQLDAASAEHDVEVRMLGTKLFRVIEKLNYHPTVVLDTLQLLLAEGIGVALGDEQKDLFEAHLRAYHQDSRMLSVASMLGINLADLIADPGPEEETPATPEAVDPKDSVATGM